jgi:DNA-binding NarL/FixJ family response regulator
LSDPLRPLRVLIASPRPIVRAGLRGLLEGRSDVEVVGESLDADGLGSIALEETIDAILIEGGAGFLHALERGALPPIVLLGSVDDTANLGTLLASGVSGFLSTDAGADEIVEAVRSVARGLVVLDAQLAPAALSPPPRRAAEDEMTDPLSERERAVLRLLAEGLPNKSIAQRLGISEHTVKFHVGSVLAKLNAASRTEAVAIGLRRGLLAL